MKHRDKTQKNYHERINRALIYIQEHFAEDISLDELAEVSCFSRYHFHRIFTAMLGESVQAYIRRLRVQHAASKMLYTNESITSVALSAGFETPSSFSKAFKKIYRMGPRQFRSKGTIVESAGPCFQSYNISRGRMMKPEIKTIPDQKVLFIRRGGDYFTAAPDAWKALTSYAKANNIDGDNIKLIGIAHDDPAVTAQEHWRFDACIAGLDNPKEDGEVGVQTIVGGKYAVFEHVGPYHKLGNTYRMIFGEWYPASNITLRDAPAFSNYVDRNFVADYGSMSDEEREKLVTHVYVPIE